MEKTKTKIISLLRWSEKYTKTDMVYLAHGGFWLTFGQMFASASTFILAIAFANLLSKETYGVYQYVLSMAGILSVFSLTGMNTAVTRAVAMGFEGILKKSFWVQMKWAMLMFLASLVVSIYYFAQNNVALGVSFLIVGSLSPLFNSANTYSAYINGKKDFKTLTLYNTISSSLTNVLLLATVFITKNPTLLILAYFIYNTATTLYFYLKTLKVFRSNENQSPENISYGKHLSIMNAIMAIASYIDGPLVFHFLGAANLAIYSLAIAPAEQIKAFLKSINTLALPKFSSRARDEIQKTMTGKVVVFSSIVAVGVLVYILLAPLFYRIFFPGYTTSILYSQIFAISLIATAFYLPSSALQGQMATKDLYRFNFWSSVVQIAMLVAFIYFWGIWGAIIARVISRFFIFTLSFWLIKKTTI